MRVHLSFVQTRHKAVTTTWHRLNEGRVFGGIAQGSAELADRDIDCMVEVSKTFLRPDTGLKFLASDQLTPVLQELRISPAWRSASNSPKRIVWFPLCTAKFPILTEV